MFPRPSCLWPPGTKHATFLAEFSSTEYINNDAYLFAAYHLVTSGLDCTWITTEEECVQVSSEVYYIYVGAVDVPGLPRGCFSVPMEYNTWMVHFNTNQQTNIECGSEVPEAENRTADCVCKGEGVTALPIGNVAAYALFQAQQGEYL